MASEKAVGKSGFIFKEGAQFLNWKKRYLVIEKDKISYYTKENKRDKKGDLLIKSIVRVAPEKGQYKGRSYVFGIHTTNRVYYVHGSDEENMNSWIGAINSLIPVPKTLGDSTGGGGSSTSGNGTMAASTGSSEKTEKPEKKKVTVDDFRQLKVIGRGGFGRVLLVEKKRHETGICHESTQKRSDSSPRGSRAHADGTFGFIKVRSSFFGKTPLVFPNRGKFIFYHGFH